MHFSFKYRDYDTESGDALAEISRTSEFPLALSKWAMKVPEDRN